MDFTFSALTMKASNPEDRSSEFEDLILSHMDMLYAVALKLTGSATDAQDLTQKTVRKALWFHAKYREGAHVKAWLLTILRNTFVNEYRGQVRRPTLVELSGTESAKNTASDPSAPYEPKDKQFE